MEILEFTFKLSCSPWLACSVASLSTHGQKYVAFAKLKTLPQTWGHSPFLFLNDNRRKHQSPTGRDVLSTTMRVRRLIPVSRDALSSLGLPSQKLEVVELIPSDSHTSIGVNAKHPLVIFTVFDDVVVTAYAGFFCM